MPFGPSPDTLTYEPFFGLTEKPFSLIADSRFVYASPAYSTTRDSLLAGLRRREGLQVLTGEIGTGKTTLCRAVLRDLGRKTYSSMVPDPFASREDLLKMLLIDFGVLSIQELTSGRLRQASRTELGYLLSEFLDSLTPDAFAVVVIDEAQNLSLPLIEESRILSDTFAADGRSSRAPSRARRSSEPFCPLERLLSIPVEPCCRHRAGSDQRPCARSRGDARTGRIADARRHSPRDSAALRS